jgi:hypothetical protein
VEPGERLVDRFSPEDRAILDRAFRGEPTQPVRFDGRWWVFLQAVAGPGGPCVRAWPIRPWEPLTLASGWSDASASLARELNDSMSIVQGRLELVCEIGGLEPILDNHLRVALDHAHRISAVLRNLRAIGQGARDFAACESGEVIAGAIDLVGAKARSIPATGAGGSASVLVDMPVVTRVAASLLTWVLEQRPQRWSTKIEETEDDVRLTFVGGVEIGEHTPESAPIDPLRPLLLATAAQAWAWRGRGTRIGQLRLMLAPPGRSRPRKTDRTLLVIGSPDLYRAISALLAEDGVDVQRAVPWDVPADADLVVAEQPDVAPGADVPVLVLGEDAVPSRRKLLAAMGRRARTVATIPRSR